MDRPAFSVIIPAYNEEKLLGSTLEAVQSATLLFQSQNPGSVQVLVVDNNSTDRTKEIAQSHGAAVLFEEKRQIARARNKGGEEAAGEVFIFCDADTRLHPETLLKIHELMKNPGILGGGIAFVPDEETSFSRCAMLLWNAVSRTLSISGGMVFARAQAFRRIQGFPEKLYVGEEVAFQMRLKAHAFKGGGRTVLLRDCPAVTSNRKFREHKPWAYLWAILLCVIFPWRATRRESCGLWYDVRNGSPPKI